MEKRKNNLWGIFWTFLQSPRCVRATISTHVIHLLRGQIWLDEKSRLQRSASTYRGDRGCEARAWLRCHFCAALHKKPKGCFALCSQDRSDVPGRAQTSRGDERRKRALRIETEKEKRRLIGGSNKQKERLFEGMKRIVWNRRAEQRKTRRKEEY